MTDIEICLVEKLWLFCLFLSQVNIWEVTKNKSMSEMVHVSEVLLGLKP